MKSDNRLTGRHILLLLCAFFGVMIIANAAFVTFAVRSFPGETQKKSYLQGLNYNETLAKRAQQAALGWRAEITRLGASQIEVRFFDEQGAPLPGLDVSGYFARPVHDGADQAFVCTERSPGVYVAELDPLGAGVWNIEAVALGRDDSRFELNARVKIQ